MLLIYFDYTLGFTQLYVLQMHIIRTMYVQLHIKLHLKLVSISLCR